jgi:hypothetical protein
MGSSTIDATKKRPNLMALTLASIAYRNKVTAHHDPLATPHRTRANLGPLYPGERTLSMLSGFSGMCQYRTQDCSDSVSSSAVCGIQRAKTARAASAAAPAARLAALYPK